MGGGGGGGGLSTDVAMTNQNWTWPENKIDRDTHFQNAIVGFIVSVTNTKP
jgi:hypothetical protein